MESHSHVPLLSCRLIPGGNMTPATRDFVLATVAGDDDQSANGTSFDKPRVDGIACLRTCLWIAMVMVVVTVIMAKGCSAARFDAAEDTMASR
ncbi:hypothetical protein IG631_23385 [Alternaria alternata]|nr:hypothetical protein IG631_23385 [Alternaria alternata]